MAYYRVEVGYRTKRGGVAVGMTVKAFGPEEAEEIARAIAIGKRPARRWCFTDIREATAADISLGVYGPAALGTQPLSSGKQTP